jgi:hypothetical protein
LPRPNDYALRKKQYCAATTVVTGLSRYYDGGASFLDQQCPEHSEHSRRNNCDTVLQLALETQLQLL